MVNFSGRKTWNWVFHLEIKFLWRAVMATCMRSAAFSSCKVA
jgi:hypothetical protein